MNLEQYSINNSYLNYYWSILILIGIYYLTPSLQFILFQSSNNIECHYNYKCKHKVGNIEAFNNVISNICYLVFGFIFIIIVKLKKTHNDGISIMGVHNEKALYYALSISLILEGISSSIYHICPSKLNFQFDTTFMIIGLLLAFLTIYNKRHKYSIIKPFKFYLMVFFVLTLNVLSLNTENNYIQLWFWGALFVFVSYVMIFGSIYIYYGKEYDLDIESFTTFISKIKSLKHKDKPRFILLVILNTFVLGSCIFAAFVKPNFTEWILMTSFVNLAIYFTHYIALKIINKETVFFKIWIAIIFDIALLVGALYFFINNPTNIFESLEDSKKLNKECVLFNYFDNHDIWHILSSMALFVFMNILLYLDDDLIYDITETVKIF